MKNGEKTILALIIISGYLLYTTNIERAKLGYFESGEMIFWNSLVYVIFFGLVTGYVITKLLKKAR